MTHVFLDFDGTLADSSQGIYLAFAAACKNAEICTPDLDTFCSHIGPPIQVIAKRLFPGIASDQLKKIRSCFRSEYDKKYYKMTDWYDGVIEGLCWLASKPEVHLSIVTNKPTQPTTNIITTAGLESLFNCVIGIDYRNLHAIGPTFDSKSEAIGFALALTNCPRQDALYMGDTPSDRQSSQQNRIRFVAATYGFHQWQPSELEGTVAARSFAEMITVLEAER